MSDYRTDALKEARQTIDFISTLRRSAGWLQVVDVLSERFNALQNKMLDPGEEISDITLREHRMALIQIRSTINLPDNLITEAEATIESLSLANPEAEEEATDDFMSDVGFSEGAPAP